MHPTGGVLGGSDGGRAGSGGDEGGLDGGTGGGGLGGGLSIKQLPSFVFAIESKFTASALMQPYAQASQSPGTTASLA